MINNFCPDSFRINETKLRLLDAGELSIFLILPLYFFRESPSFLDAWWEIILMLFNFRNYALTCTFLFKSCKHCIKAFITFFLDFCHSYFLSFLSNNILSIKKLLINVLNISINNVSCIISFIFII